MSRSRVPARHRHRRTGPLASVALATGLVLVGCGSPSGTDGTPEGGPAPGVMEFGLTEVQFVRHVEETQALIAACMSDAGFEYVPVDVQTIQDAQARVRHDPGLTRRQYKQRYGLAVTTRFDNPVRDTGLGPNLRIWKSLPPQTQEAYSRTLWGEDPDADFVFALDEEDFSATGGCTREAVAQVFTPAQLEGTYVNPKDVLLESDPRVVEALDKWTDCMREMGYDYEDDQDDIIDEYEERLEELAGGDDPTSLTGPRAEALRRLQQEEIEVSLADLDCQIEHTDDVIREVEIEVFGQPVSG